MENRPSLQSIYPILEALVKTSFAGEGKLFIDQFGNVLLGNITKLQIDFIKEQNFLNFIQPHFEQLSASFLDKMTTTNAGFEGIFHLEASDQWFKVLINAINITPKSLFLVQFFDITKATKINLQLARHRKNIENEMLLRTQEVIMTDRAMTNRGGYLGNFLRGLRHDLKSPITQLQEIINFYKKTTDPTKKAKAAELIDNCLRKLQTTSSGFSSFVDLHFLPEAKPKALSFATTFQASYQTLKDSLVDQPIEIETDFSKAPQVRFNENLLQSIFYNLLSNAIKFKSEQRTLSIKVSSTLRDNTVVLTIEDNGIGMDLAKHGHLVFAPFKRINADRPSAGIGLSLLKNTLAKEDRGTIEIVSELGQGTSVSVVFNSQEELA